MERMDDLHAIDRPCHHQGITIPPVLPANLGDRSFLDDHGLRYPYLAGAMAHEFVRTASRLVEMQSSDYLEAPRRAIAERIG